MKKILIFSLAYFPKPVAGAEIAVKEITDRISDIEFHLITNRFESAQSSEEKIGNVHVHRVGEGASYLSKIFFIPRAVRLAIRLQGTHAFDGAWALMSYMALPLVGMRFFGIRLPYCLTLQEGDTFEHMFRRARILPVLPLLSLAFRSATIVQTISQYLATWPPRMGYRGEVVVIPNGADVPRFSGKASDAAINEIRDRLQKKMGEVLLITSSRLVYKNAIDDVIRALPLLPKNVRFCILGEGEEKAKLQEIANNLHVAHRVEFCGFVSHDELPLYLKAADIFIRPSRSEGMGSSFVEAMAAGLPIIATQVGGIADFLFDEKRNPDKPITGWAVEPDSPQNIADAVRSIMEQPEKVRAVVATAKALIAEKYDWNVIVRDMREKVFAPILGK